MVMKAVDHPEATYYGEELIRMAVDIAVGDDGFKGRKVLDILRSLIGEDPQ